MNRVKNAAFTRSRLQIWTIKGGNTALVRHELHAKTNDGGKPGEAHLGVLLVWQKQGKDWLLLARQAFKLSN